MYTVFCFPGEKEGFVDLLAYFLGVQQSQIFLALLFSKETECTPDWILRKSKVPDGFDV